MEKDYEKSAEHLHLLNMVPVLVMLINHRLVLVQPQRLLIHKTLIWIMIGLTSRHG